MQTIARIADFTVIGGGLVGMSIALGLLQHGLTVTVLDEGDAGIRASRGNFGLVWVQGKGTDMPAYSIWSQRSSDMWPAFAEMLLEEAGVDVQFSRPGGYYFCFNEEEFTQRAALLRESAGAPGNNFTYEMLDRKEVKARLPLIGETVFGASYSPSDGHVNSLRLFFSLHKAFGRRGGTYLPNSAVDNIRHERDNFVTAASTGTYVSKRLVIAAGNGSRRLAPMVGLRAPVAPERGQILVTAKVCPFLPVPTHVLRQTGDGSVIMGDSKEETGFDDGTTPGVMRDIAARAVRTFPILRDAKVIRSWGALRIMTPDGYPVYQESRSCPGAFVACLHSGVTLAAAHVGALARDIAEGGLSAEFNSFKAERFDVQQVA
ncbi:NAD(P)/FAD-dependent oxidoreductase [Rhizobium binxianense]